MKKTLKTIVASAILLTVLSLSTFADGNMQCPNSAAPCLVGSSNVEIKTPIALETNEQDILNTLIVKMIQTINFLF